MSKTTVTQTSANSPLPQNLPSTPAPVAPNPRAQVTANNDGFKMVGGQKRMDLPKERIIPAKVGLSRHKSSLPSTNNLFSSLFSSNAPPIMLPNSVGLMGGLDSVPL